MEDEIHFLAKTIVDHWEDAEVQGVFFELVERMVGEQSFKVPFVAAVVLAINGMGEVGGKVTGEVVGRMAEKCNRSIEAGEWRDVKLSLKFLGGLQGVLEGEGVWIVLQDLLTKAVDLQTENNEEVSSVFSREKGETLMGIDDWSGAGQDHPIYDSIYHGFVCYRQRGEGRGHG